VPVRVQISRRIHRSLDPPVDHAGIARRIRGIAGPLCSPGREVTLSVVLSSDRAIREANARWLGRDRATNVIAFPSPAMAAHTAEHGILRPAPAVLDDLVPPDGPPWHAGDVIASVETAEREAGPHGRDDRTCYLVVHGLLHVLGWIHDDERSWRRMHRTTVKLLAEGLPVRRRPSARHRAGRT